MLGEQSPQSWLEFVEDDAGFGRVLDTVPTREETTVYRQQLVVGEAFLALIESHSQIVDRKVPGCHRSVDERNPRRRDVGVGLQRVLELSHGGGRDAGRVLDSLECALNFETETNVAERAVARANVPVFRLLRLPAPAVEARELEQRLRVFRIDREGRVDAGDRGDLFGRFAVVEDGRDVVVHVRRARLHLDIAEQERFVVVPEIVPRKYDGDVQRDIDSEADSHRLGLLRELDQEQRHYQTKAEARRVVEAFAEDRAGHHWNVGRRERETEQQRHPEEEKRLPLREHETGDENGQQRDGRRQEPEIGGRRDD